MPSLFEGDNGLDAGQTVIAVEEGRVRVARDGRPSFARFVETLPQVLPVRLVRRGEVTEVVAR